MFKNGGGTEPTGRALIDMLALRDRVQDVIRGSQSGRELIDAGYAGDVEIAIEMDASHTVPLLRSDGYSDASPSPI